MKHSNSSNNKEHRVNRLKKFEYMSTYDTTVNTISHTELHFAWQRGDYTLIIQHFDTNCNLPLCQLLILISFCSDCLAPRNVFWY